MNNYVKSSVSAFAISLMVIGGVSATGPAFAGSKVKNEHGNNGRSNVASVTERVNNGRNSTTSVTERVKNDNGVLASARGALNAAHASANARENASSDSRVGQIAIYEAAVYNTLEAQAAVDLATEALAEFGEYAPVYADYEEALAAYEASLLEADADVDFETELAYWEANNALTDANADLEEARALSQITFFAHVDVYDASEALGEFGDYTPVYASYEEAQAAYEASLLEADPDAETSVEAVNYETELAYWEASATLADAEAVAAEAEEAEAAALEVVANKELTDEVIASLWDLLNIGETDPVE